ncbi:conserved repeat protein [Rivularia sp. PCC 7116]|uniref:GEVED domain-containing protein n=1 Tax=Rivularia sp. PCC 7116 TaxID=373994 RepID=UPI00029ED117|nr:GEVED domain-containing protein [Rivularia sp. PCC 7116]AFY56043.1 conserved repeat protein [Rivularia sp. PCC 7116]
MCFSSLKSINKKSKKKFSQKLAAGTNLGIMSAIAKYSKVLSTSIYKLVPLSAVVLTPTFLTTAPALAAVDQVCYLISDVGGTNGNDFLVKMNTDTGQFFQISSGTGTNNIEAAAAQPGTNILFAANQESSGRLGTIDLITGAFTPRANLMGTGNGERGSINFRDPDGLAFDPTDGTLYASIRTGDGGSPPDILIKVDPVTGRHIPDAFGTNVDYVVIQPQNGRDDIDGIAIDPADGTLYGIANEGSTGGNQNLVTINKNTGATSLVGELQENGSSIDDVEDIAFDLNGKLYISTGSSGSTRNRLYDVDKNTAAVSNRRPLTIGGDYEASGCFLLPPVDVSLNKTVNDNSPNVNDIVTFTLTLTNDAAASDNAYSDVNNLVVEDVLPTNLEFDSFVTIPSGTTPTYDIGSRTVTWNVNEVLKGNNTTLQFRARVTGSGSITNSAQVTSIREFDVDSTPNNNQASEDDQSSVSLTVVAPTSTTISGTLYEDSDGGDDLDASEPKLPADITVNLLDNNNSVIKTTTTDANGAYTFTDVVNGNYKIQVDTNDSDIPNGYTLGTPNDLAVTVSGSAITNQNFGFDKTSASPPLTACPANSLLTEQTILNFQNPTPEPGTTNGDFSIGAVYRFPNVAANTDALVEVIALNNATIAQLDVTTTGLVSAFQPEVQSNSTNPSEYSVDFQIRFVQSGTSTPINLNTVLATSVDTDGDNTVVREFVQFSGNAPNSYTIETPSKLTATQIDSTTIRLESQSTDVNPGINLNTANMGSVKYDQVGVFNYRAGLIIGNNPPSNVSNQRLNSLYFECVSYNNSNSNPVVPVLDYGDAPDSYGTTSANNGANHAIVSGIHLGTAPDSETDAATPLDGSGDGAEDDGINLPTLNEGDTSYTIPAENITATGTGTLHAWLDFDKNGTFEPGEYTSVAVTNGTAANDLSWSNINAGAAGDTYARFRFTTDAGIDANTPGGGASDGEVEDYQIAIEAIANNPNILLIKRITKINNGITTNNGDNLAIYNQEDSNPYDDNKLDNPAPDPVDTDKWLGTTSDTSSTFLIGGIDGGKVEPDDEIEYTIYYLSGGDSEAKNVLFCDRVPENVTFVTNSFNGEANQATGGLQNADRGIQWLKDGNTESLTNVKDGDVAQYFPPGIEPSTVYPKIKCDGTNTNGAVVVNLGNLPLATAPGTPNTSYGFVRFRGRVK